MNHIENEFEYGCDIADTLGSMKTIDFDKRLPRMRVSQSTVEEDRVAEQASFEYIYRLELEEHLQRTKYYEINLRKAYALIYFSYCSEGMQQRIREHPEYETTNMDKDPIKILELISLLMNNPIRARYPMATLTESLARIINMRQKEDESLDGYLDRFKQERSIVKSHLGTNFLETFIENTKEFEDIENNYDNEDDRIIMRNKMKKQLFESLMAFIFMRGSDRTRYSKLVENLQEQYSLKVDLMPKTIADAMDAMRQVKKSSHKKAGVAPPATIKQLSTSLKPRLVSSNRKRSVSVAGVKNTYYPTVLSRMASRGNSGMRIPENILTIINMSRDLVIMMITNL